MCQKLALELALQWLGVASVPDNRWMLNKDCYEEHLHSITRLLATSKLDSMAACDFVAKCWRALLAQYTMVLHSAHDNGFCTPIWYRSEKKRLKDLREEGPRQALASLQGVLQWYPTEQQLIFQVGGGDPAAETYLDYLEVKEGCLDSESEVSDPDDVESRAMSESDSESDQGSWTGEDQRYKDWVVMLNCQRWISVTTMIQKCPGMRPFGGVLSSLSKDSLVFEKAWVDSWPMRWKVCIRLP